MGENKVDFAIITAIEVERQAVCQALGMGDQHRIREGVRTYWKTQLDLKDRQFYEIVVTQLPDVASVDAALAVAHVIAKWSPGAILMVGIAGAAKADLQLGDLVLGQEVYYYERGKEITTGKIPEPKQYPADATLWDRVINIAKWESPIPVPRPDETDTRPKIHRGVIASGEKVIASAEVRSEIISTNRKIAAIEMEGYGVSAAAWKQDKSVPCLVIRAISDRADVQKDDTWQPYAAAVAAEFTKHFLLDQPRKPRNPRHPQTQVSVDEFKFRYRLIIDGLKTGTLVPFLGPGINPSFYIDLAHNLTKLVREDLMPGNGENNWHNEKWIQLLIGLPCSNCPYWQDRPKECPMLKNIDGSSEDVEKCPLYIEQLLAVSKMHLRYLSQYYILKHSPESLYDNLYEILDDIEQSYQPTSIHRFLAKLPHFMLAHNYPRRSPGLPFQLIVTTNYDDLLERAFLEVNQPFDVVFYIADESGKFKHKPYDGEPETIGVDDSNRLPLPRYSQQPRPIILKLFGTWEDLWENNFVVTEQQTAYLISILKKNLPTNLVSILERNHILFMGYSLDFSHLWIASGIYR